MHLQWIINAMVQFAFCLALPEVIHLPRGLGAVTHNWRNHNCMELSAAHSPPVKNPILQHQEVGTFAFMFFSEFKFFLLPCSHRVLIFFFLLFLLFIWDFYSQCRAAGRVWRKLTRKSFLRISSSVSTDQEVMRAQDDSIRSKFGTCYNEFSS